jgi:hypothetical protein
MGQIDESCLWHKIMGHIRFNHLIKFSRNEAMKDMPKIIKLSNYVYRNCQHGKQTKSIFKTKQFSTSKPLKIVHTELCGPTRTKIVQGAYYSI